MQGWTETISAGSGIIFAIGLGLINYVHCGKGKVDVIPVDYVTNLVITATVSTAFDPPATLNVVHATTTGCNPATFRGMTEDATEHFKNYPFSRQVF
jgi:hypothetical protein